MAGPAARTGREPGQHRHRGPFAPDRDAVEANRLLAGLEQLLAP
jgi:hypothetical protein